MMSPSVHRSAPMEEDMDTEQRDRLARLIQGIEITAADG